MKNKGLHISYNKDYRSGRDYYSVIDNDYNIYGSFGHYEEAHKYIKYYLGYDDPFEKESKEDRLRREKAIKRNKKIDQILGE